MQLVDLRFSCLHLPHAVVLDALGHAPFAWLLEELLALTLKSLNGFGVLQELLLFFTLIYGSLLIVLIVANVDSGFVRD